MDRFSLKNLRMIVSNYEYFNVTVVSWFYFLLTSFFCSMDLSYIISSDYDRIVFQISNSLNVFEKIINDRYGVKAVTFQQRPSVSFLALQ